VAVLLFGQNGNLPDFQLAASRYWCLRFSS